MDRMPDRPLYAVCPRCGRRGLVTGFEWDWEEYATMAQVRCTCGRSRMLYDEDRVLQMDLRNPYMREEHFDLLVPQNWNHSMWDTFAASLPKW